MKTVFAREDIEIISPSAGYFFELHFWSCIPEVILTWIHCMWLKTATYALAHDEKSHLPFFMEKFNIFTANSSLFTIFQNHWGSLGINFFSLRNPIPHRDKNLLRRCKPYYEPLIRLALKPRFWTWGRSGFTNRQFWSELFGVGRGSRNLSRSISKFLPLVEVIFLQKRAFFRNFLAIATKTIPKLLFIAFL